MTDEEKQRLRELCEKATPGPWKTQEWRHWADPNKSNFSIQYTAADMWNKGADFALATIELYGSGSGDSRANAAFIAASRTAIPALLELVESLTGQRDSLRAMFDQAKRDHYSYQLALETMTAERDALYAAKEEALDLAESSSDAFESTGFDDDEEAPAIRGHIRRLRKVGRRG